MQSRPRRIFGIIGLLATAMAASSCVPMLPPRALPARPHVSTPARKPVAKPKPKVAPKPVGMTYAVRRSLVGVNGAGFAAPAIEQRELDAIAASGAQWVRTDLNWPTIEQARGQFNWQPADEVVHAAAARHLNVLGIIGYRPWWTNGNPTAADYAAFAGAMARRYAPLGVHAWEIWNEPNLRGAWGAAPDPRTYTAMLKAAYKAIHAADPRAIVVAGALSPAGDVAGQAMRPTTFLRSMYAYGARGSFDALSVHITMTPFAPTVNESWSVLYAASTELYPLLQRNGDGAKKIWATEAGYSTTTDRTKGIAETSQGGLLTQMLRIWLAKSFAGPVFVYTVRDTGTDKTNWFDNLGLLRNDFTRKPGYASLVSFVRNG